MSDDQQTTAAVDQELQESPKTERDGGGDDGKKSACAAGRSERYPCLFRLSHWLLLISAVVLFATGMSLHKSTHLGYKGSGLWGPLPIYHIWGALVFTPATIGAIWVARRQICKLRNWSVALLMLVSLVMVVSGLVILACPAATGLLVASEKVHRICGLVILPVFFLIHILRTLGRRRSLIVPSFSMRPSRCGICSMLWFVLLAAATTGLILYTPGISLPGRDLKVVPIDEFLAQNRADVSVDGRVDPAKLPWDKANPVTIPLRGGANFGGTGKTTVELRALCSDDRLWVCAQWDDPVEDRRNQPWKRTEDGWERQISNPKDETIYYEDKFSILFPIGNDPRFDAYGCLAYCHLDPERGWGYKGLPPADTTGKVDVWHWKSTRTDPAGQCDDKYWDACDFELKNIGRHGDPKPASGPKGGYVKNVGAEDASIPGFLPDDSPEAVLNGAILSEHAVEYTEELAASIEPDTILPGIVTAPFLGDRGDVSADSSYKDGRWTLYLSRKRDTDSEYDVRFMPEGAIPFAVAAFEHAAKRHAYHYTVYRLIFPPKDPNQPAELIANSDDEHKTNASVE